MSKSGWNPSWSDEDDSNESVDHSLSSNEKLKDTEREAINNRAKWKNLGMEASSEANGKVNGNELHRTYAKNKIFKNWGPNQSSGEDESGHSEVKLSKSSSNFQKHGFPSTELRCTECKKVFSKSIHLTLHMKIHARMDKPATRKLAEEGLEEPVQFDCKHCGRNFERENQLKFHKRLCTKSSQKTTPEPTTQTHLKQEATIDGTKSKLLENVKLECDKCERTFKRKNQLNIHRTMCKTNTSASSVSASEESTTSDANEASTQLLSFSCTNCDRKFERKMQLNFHKALCKGKAKMVASVEIVDKLNTPETKVHESFEKASSLVCPACKRTFDRPNQLKLHSKVCKLKSSSVDKRSAATDVKISSIQETLTCENCKRSFERENQLKFHRKLCKSSRTHVVPQQSQPMPVVKKEKIPMETMYESDNDNDSVPVVAEEIPRQELPYLQFFNSNMKSLTEICEGCSKQYLKSELEEHKKICFEQSSDECDNEKSFQPKIHQLRCRSCGKHCVDECSLKEHQQIHEFGIVSFEENTQEFLEKTLPFTCIVHNCQSRFNDALDLDFHVQKAHQLPGLSNPKFYYMKANQKPPLNPYVLLTRQVQEVAETNIESYESSGSEFNPNEAPRLLKRRLKKPRGRQPRSDIPYQNFYVCKPCNKKFHLRNRYIIHINQHKMADKLRCEKCNRSFLSRPYFEAHMSKHEADPNYVSTPRRGRFREDIPIADTYTCEQCNKTFDQRNYYIIHLSAHKREEKYRCKFCERKLPTEYQYLAHMNLHNDPNYVFRRRVRESIPHQSVYTCEVCQQTFKDRTLYLIHRREEKFKCHECNRGFQSQNQLDTHKQRHDPSFVPGKRGPKPTEKSVPHMDAYMCEICQQIINSREEYIAHASQHKRSEQFVCDICQYRYSSAAMLAEHKKRHTDPTHKGRHPKTFIPVQDVYWCDECEKVIGTRGSYIVHRFNHRKGLIKKPRIDLPFQDVYTCEQCDKTFTERIKFIQHRYLHRNGRQVSKQKGRKSRLNIPFQDVYYCEQCNFKKSFTDRIKYYHHIRNHRLERSHRCDGCLKSYKTPAARDIHREKFCKGIPCKFKCSRCPDRFHNKITLARHFQRFHAKSLETAETEVEYPCTLCSQTFNTTFGLTRHRQVYHPDTENVPIETDMHENPENESHFSDGNENSWHSGDADDDVHPMLAADLCQTELIEKRPESASDHNESNELDSDVVKQTVTESGKSCHCVLLKKKYQSQKICHNQKCSCCQAGIRCSKSCNCDSTCLNSDEMEDAQKQIFQEGKENLVTELEDEDEEEAMESLPVIATYPNSVNDRGHENRVMPKAESTESASISKFIPTSEFITVCDDEDESMRQLSFEGFVEGADFDPLSDLPMQVETAKPEVKVSTSSVSNYVVETHKPPLVPAAKASNSVESSFRNPSLSQNAGSSTTSTQDNFTASNLMRCQFCKKNFKIMPVFISHILLHEVEKFPLQCPCCPNEFQNVVTYVNHLDIHNKGEDLQCKKCTSKFKSSNDMKKHLEVHHFRPMECGACLTKFANSQVMMQHWSKSHPTCQCGLCNLKFFSYDDLTYHMKSLHSPYDCLRCNNRFESLVQLMDHFTQVHCQKTTQQFNPMLTCSFCGSKFSNHEDFNEHLSKHLTNKTYSVSQYECQQCKASFRTAEDLQIHLTDHLLQTSGRSPTPLITYSPRNQDHHERRDKKEDSINDNIQAVEVLTCPKCGKGFNNRNGWKIHVISHQLFVCAACDSVLETKEELQKHLEVNSCVVHSCKICNRNFQQDKHLHQHMKVVHGSQKNFQYGGDQNAQHGNSFPVIVGSTSLAQYDQGFNSLSPRSTGHKNTVTLEVEEITLE